MDLNEMMGCARVALTWPSPDTIIALGLLAA